MTTLAVEISASRLLGTVFGTSNLVWANIIGLILVYLAAGYFLGGRWADRSPHFTTFYSLLAWGALASGLIPLVARPVLRAAAAAVENLDAAVMGGSFIGVLILFSVPVTLLGCASPFAIRLALTDPVHAGRVSGQMYAISTLGSIIGTFIPVLWLIPTVGTAWTFLSFSGLLMAVALIGLYRAAPRRALTALWMPGLLALLAWLLMRGPLKPTPGLLYETESAYNYIQVVERDGIRYLLLNEGQGVHSIYNPETLATGGTWDYFLAARFFYPPARIAGSTGVHASRITCYVSPVTCLPPSGGHLTLASRHPSQVRSLALVGLAAGTISKQHTAVFGPIPIDGYEIDPGIVEAGRRFFAMDEPNLTVHVEDGRWGLGHSSRRYDVVGVDAYRLPYIPWHLTTREFFEEVRAHLEPQGALAINVGRTFTDRRLIEAMAGTLESVFPSVYVIDVPDTFNSVLVATVQPTQPTNLAENYELIRNDPAIHSLLKDVLGRTILNLQPTPASTVVFTDDKAPVEALTNSIVIRFVLSGSFLGLSE